MNLCYLPMAGTSSPLSGATRPCVRLINIFESAFDNFVATARTCYSGKGVVTPEDVRGPSDQTPEDIELRMARKVGLARSLYKAGHHTTLQHCHIQFALEGVSRQALWSFFHAHPFYNSEQVSQRYVPVKSGHFFIPEGVEQAGQTDYFLAEAQARMEEYRQLASLLEAVVAEEYYARFRGRHNTKRALADIQKRSQEAARYVLPISTTAYLYHTISLLTLLRYWRLAHRNDCPAEVKSIVAQMVDALLAEDPQFAEILEEPLPHEDPTEHSPSLSGIAPLDRTRAALWIQQFDKQMGGKTSILVDRGQANESLLAESVREVLGLSLSELSEEAAISMALNPSENRLLGESLSLVTLSKIGRCLHHPRYVFRKCLSHAADSQDQRHRMTPGSRPDLIRHYTGQPDYITPAPVARNLEANALYKRSMEASWACVEHLLTHGVSPEAALYMLPNALKIRFTESSDLLNLHHKMAMRLCWNAQEEIWRASVDEASAIQKVEPQIGRWLLPPCGLRKAAGTRPICPEGDRYCGVPVWRQERDTWNRVI
jgi:flavin-dependent thymidylate synthase